MQPIRTLWIAALTACTTYTTLPDDAVDPSRIAEVDEKTEDPARYEVSIRRDRYGVPHIEADDDRAAFYGIGWAAAEDRLYDMHTRVLGVQGRLAEHWGAGVGLDADDPTREVLYDKDLKARTLGTWRNAERKAAALDAETAALLQAYADGVNAYVAANEDDLSPLFAGEGVDVQEWTVAHVIAAWHSLADDYSLPAFGEASLRETYEDEDGTFDAQAASDDLWAITLPGISEHGVVQEDDVHPDYVATVQAYAERIGAPPATARYPVTGTEGPHFSHAFALADWRTEEGGAMLVADPQLPVLLPSVWWEFQVDSPGFTARGVATPGTPGIAVGQSEAVAWGITAGSIDQADLFQLTLGNADGTYVVDDTVYRMLEETEVIEIEGLPSRRVTYKETLWGPVVDAILPDDVDQSYALKSILLNDEEPDTIVGMLGMMASQDLRQFVTALDDWQVPSVNVVAASSDGHVYYSLVGGMPVRPEGHGFAGYLAQDGDARANDWLDIAPHAVMPQVTDPASGTVFSGNHRPAGDWYPLAISYPVNGGGHSHRSARIRDLLDNDEVFDAERLLNEVQNDCVDGSRQRFVQLALHLVDTHPGALSGEASRTVNFLRDWAERGSMASDEPDAWLASKLLLSFRLSETGWALLETYGTSEPGMVNFLDVQLAAIEADPDHLPGDAELAYIETILDLAIVDLEPASEWPDLWHDTYAVMSIEDHVSIDGVPTAEPFAIRTEPLTCGWTNTIHAQRTQSFTQFVDYGSGRSESVKAPGQSESRDDGSYLAEMGLWTYGLLKLAPVDAAGATAIAREIEVVTYAP